MTDTPPFQARFPTIPLTAELVEMPYSEVCMHMRVAGSIMWVEPLPHNMAQLYTLGGDKFSMPITRGEAGLPYDFDLKPRV